MRGRLRAAGLGYSGRKCPGRSPLHLPGAWPAVLRSPGSLACSAIGTSTTPKGSQRPAATGQGALVSGVWRLAGRSTAPQLQPKSRCALPAAQVGLRSS